ncbi:RES family NAD+ phosphorylase [Erwinia sp. BNK-24-b]|uniref:RES family NAD+ phosphorylase n=1 Tax=unclassified Erwinia TaxID=2622719 RepID=UPI0039BF1A20
MEITNYLINVKGIFYRAIDPLYRDVALSGSRVPGRYSDSNQPTLYLSSSPEGVEAALKAHNGARRDRLEIIKVSVIADKIFDLRNLAGLQAANIDINDALAPWQETVSQGSIPESWRVRNRLESYGINGLIDPSRKAPGLWHLVLFSWNQESKPSVSLYEAAEAGLNYDDYQDLS